MAHSENDYSPPSPEDDRLNKSSLHASAPNWKAQGLKPFSAQSVATRKSAELAREEMERATAAGVTVLSPEEARYPSR
jgi:hypothetical protein